MNPPVFALVVIVVGDSYDFDLEAQIIILDCCLKTKNLFGLYVGLSFCISFTGTSVNILTSSIFIDYLPKKEKLIYKICSQSCACDNRLMKSELSDDSVRIYVNGQYYTNYYFGGGTVKPYLGPFIGKYGEQVTRLDFDVSEHPHHRSL